MQIIDTHCHIHDPEFAISYQKTVQQMIDEAKADGVWPFIVVGTSAQSSELAVEFAKKHSVYATIAIHPHEAAELQESDMQAEQDRVARLVKVPPVVAVGECGLDYFYHASQAIRQSQQQLFRWHIDLALAHDLPMVFHIRDAFDDFFAIIDEYKSKGQTVTGVVHSFSAHKPQLLGSIERGFYISLNGIMTFTKDEKQIEAAKAVPLGRLVLETDAPFLTPKPFRGKMCEIKQVVLTAQFLSELRGESLEQLSQVTTANAQRIFRL